MPTREVSVKILQVLDQIGQCVGLRSVVGIILKVAKPGIILLPMNIFDRLHKTTPSCPLMQYSNDSSRNGLTGRLPPARNSRFAV